MATPIASRVTSRARAKLSLRGEVREAHVGEERHPARRRRGEGNRRVGHRGLRGADGQRSLRDGLCGGGESKNHEGANAVDMWSLAGGSGIQEASARMSSDRSGSSGPQASRAACRLQYVGESSSEIILGIDLGTTYSTAAAFVEGKLQFALDSRGEACVPSVVHFPKSGAPVVGADAERLRGTDPQNTVWGIKRLIGQTADSPAARVLDASSAFTITSDQPGGEGSHSLAASTAGRRRDAHTIRAIPATTIGSDSSMPSVTPPGR